MKNNFQFPSIVIMLGSSIKSSKKIFYVPVSALFINKLRLNGLDERYKPIALLPESIESSLSRL